MLLTAKSTKVCIAYINVAPLFQRVALNYYLIRVMPLTSVNIICLAFFAEYCNSTNNLNSNANVRICYVSINFVTIRVRYI